MFLYHILFNLEQKETLANLWIFVYLSALEISSIMDKARTLRTSINWPQEDNSKSLSLSFFSQINIALRVDVAWSIDYLFLQVGTENVWLELGMVAMEVDVDIVEVGIDIIIVYVEVVRVASITFNSVNIGIIEFTIFIGICIIGSDIIRGVGIFSSVIITRKSRIKRRSRSMKISLARLRQTLAL